MTDEPNRPGQRIDRRFRPSATIQCRRCGSKVSRGYAEDRSNGLCVTCFTRFGAPVIDWPPPEQDQ